jgi:AcrR family transcriptional regulator
LPASRKRAGLPTDAQIVDAALAMGAEVGWPNLRLRRLAEQLDIPLAELQARFRDADAIADAWFARAQAAMLAEPDAAFAALPPRERLERLIWRWFAAQAPQRRVVVQMLRTKLYPGHLHHWVPLAFHLSRQIQWVRDAAALDAGGRRRQVEEIGLTALFLATLCRWAADDSPDQERTRAFLRQRLRDADRGMAALFGAARG